jgi:hypothetical protein
MGLEETVSECSDKKQRILVVDGERLDPAILERLAVAEVKVPLLPSATRCTACGAKEGEPCRGNCERAIPSSTRDIDEHGVLHGWRAAIAKACGNNDPVTPDGVERVVAAHVRHHVLGAAPVSASGATDYSGQAALLRSFAARIRDFNRPITPDSVIPHTLEDIADELDPVDRKAESPEGHQRSWEDHGGHKL